MAKQSDAYLTSASDVMTVLGDGGHFGQELVTLYAEVVDELTFVQVPDEQRKGLLDGVSTDTLLAIVAG